MWHAWSWPLIEERPQRSLALSRIFLFMAAFSSSHVEAWLHVHCPGLEKKWRRPNNNFKPCTRLVTGSTGATTNEDIPLSSCSTANCNEGPNYIVNFIQLATSAQQPATHCFKPATPQIQQFIPKCGYALKIGEQSAQCSPNSKKRLWFSITIDKPTTTFRLIQLNVLLPWGRGAWNP